MPGPLPVPGSAAAMPAGYVAYQPAAQPPRGPSRGAVFGQILWRTIVLSMVGGAVIGTGFIVVGSLVSKDSDLAGFSLAAGFVGAVLGLFLGVPAGLVLGGLGCALLVPYRGKGTTHWSARIGGVVAVSVFYALIWGDNSFHSSEWPALVGLTVPGLAGAFFGSLFLVRWYTKRMGD